MPAFARFRAAAFVAPKMLLAALMIAFARVPVTLAELFCRSIKENPNAPADKLIRIDLTGY